MDLRSDLSSIIGVCNNYLSVKDRVREKALKMSRDIIRSSGKTITLIVSNRLEEAGTELEALRGLVKEYLEILRPHPELFYSGSTYNAVSEYVEAELLYQLVSSGSIKGPDKLGIPVVPYLLGLGDVVGELRRLSLEYIRRGDIENAWKMLGYMEDIYYSLRTLDYPDALAPGLRHKVDVARRLVDQTKSLLIDISEREKLVKMLSEFKRGMMTNPGA